jgi:very-short-patch-repair endonuclease
MYLVVELVKRNLGIMIEREPGGDNMSKPEGINIAKKHSFPEFQMSLTPQVNVPDTQYRVDFLLSRIEVIGENWETAEAAVAVECDGKEVHITGDVDKYDNDQMRSLELQEKGYRVARFSGSRLYREPEKVLGELIDTLNQMFWEEVRKVEGKNIDGQG